MPKHHRILACALLLPLIGCGSTAPPKRDPSPFGPAQSTNLLPPLPETDEKLPLFAVFGQTLIVPASSVLGPGGRIPQAKLDDGREVTVSIRRVLVEPFTPTQAFGALENSASRWIGPIGRWHDSPAKTSPRTIEFCEIELPPDAIGHWLWLGAQHIDLAWIPAEKPLKFEIPSLSPEARGDAFVRECLRLEGMNPLARWRSSLFGITLPPATQAAIPFAPDATEAIVRPKAPAVGDLLADRQAALWNHALSHLQRADAVVYRRVLTECSRVVRFEGATTRFAPAWADAAQLQLLLDQLLINRDNPRALGAAATAWLAKRPPACAWVNDDAGLLDADSRLPLPRIGVANLGDASALGWAGGKGESQSPELLSIPPDRAQILAIPALSRPAPTDGSNDAQMIEAHVGSWSSMLAVNRRSVIARPPGLMIAPTYIDHALMPWTMSQSISPLPSGERSQVGALAARLVREAGPTNIPSGSGWSIYMEVERSAFEHQTVRIWFGPINRPTHVVQVELPETSRIPESGEAVATVREPGARDALLPGAQIIPAATHWSLRLPVPNRAVERPGLVRFGVEHIRGNLRSSWPRAIFPWATEPARACVDLTRW